MTRQELFAWCMDQYGTEPEYPWRDKENGENNDYTKIST